MKFFLVFAVSALYLMDQFIECSSTNATLNSLCSFKKSLQECLCVYKKDSSSIFPILYADCSRMGLKDFPKMEDVEELDLSHNSIEILDPNKTNFTSLRIRTLRVSFNRIDFIFQGFFKEMPNLINLDLSNNELVMFTNSVVFRGLSRLEVLNLRSNHLSTLPENIFLSLPNLKELDLSYNYLGSLFSNSDSLFKSGLGLSRNVTTLNLDGLGITSISPKFFDDAKNLRRISLANNPLKSIPNTPYELIYLDLSGFDITNITAKSLTCHSLKTLKLNRLSKLETIEDFAFYSLQELEELHLNDCKKLKELNPASFGTSSLTKNTQWALKRLYMTRSGLRKISSEFFHFFKSMEYVDLENNPWTCDCDLLWLQKLNTTHFKDANLRCASPNSLLNKKVMELTEGDLANCITATSYYTTILIAIFCCLVAVLSALIVYLLYLGPFYYKNKYRNIGPQSPYTGNTLCAPSTVETNQENIS